MGRRDILFASLILAGVAWTLGPLVPLRGVRSESQPTTTSQSARLSGSSPLVTQLNASLRGQPDPEVAGRPPRTAADLVILRRVHLALTGAIPSLTAVRAFEALPAEPGRLDRWVEGLLLDRRASAYLAERLARSLVGVEDGPFLVFRRRRFVAWLADAIQENRPYDQIVRSLVADAGLGTDHPATNFLAVTYDEATRSYDAEALASRVARAFLGVRLDCAQCHDHPFAPWRRADFQGLAAFFGQVEARASGVVDGSGEFRADARSTQPGAAIAPRVPFAGDCLPEAGTRRERLAGWITDRRNHWFARSVVNRVWAILVGRPLVEPIDDIADADPATIPPALDLLATDFTDHGYDLRRLIQQVVASDALRLDSSTQDDSADAATAVAGDGTPTWTWGRSFPITRLRPEQLAGSLVQVGTTATIDENSHLLVRLIAAGSINDFIAAHGDLGADEFAPAGPATIPQRLLLMNGGLATQQVRGGIATAAGRIAQLASDDACAVEAAFLLALTRRPTPDEARHFVGRLRATDSTSRDERLSDLVWALINSTEFSTNH